MTTRYVPMTTRRAPKDIDAYIGGFSPDVQSILERIRATVHAAAPGAEEIISYRIPAFRLDAVLVYFAAFKAHVGLYPPVSGDARLEKAVAPYAGERGNLRFPVDRPIPYALIARIVKHRVKQNRARVVASMRKKSQAKKRRPSRRNAPA